MGRRSKVEEGELFIKEWVKELKAQADTLSEELGNVSAQIENLEKLI